LSTPLHIAALLGRTEIARNMLDKGVNRFLRNNTGATAFDITAGPFEADIPIYAKLAQALGPLGLQLDYEQIKANRATIAQLLKPDPAELHAINYTPVELDDWQISTPQKQGLDPALIAELYLDAAQLENLHSLLVIKNGYLVAENYSDRGAIDQKDLLQSVSKSYTSALVGIALDQGCLANVNQTILRFFPELADTISDPRKHQITVQHLLQMRGGFPWEESAPALWEAVLSGSYLPRIETFSLTGDPGTLFNYSNLSSHWLGVIVARACHTDLKSFAQKYLFSPLKSQPGPWLKDRDGYYLGFAEMHFSAREVGRFGLMYLNSGKYKGQQIVPASWVRDSLTNYSDDAWIASNRETKDGRYFRDLGYGYQWWSATINEQHVDFAWGHGGQLIVLLKNHNMVLVTTAYPFYGESNNRSWRHERAVFNLVGKFIQALSH
jgi:CubicO group peptidase (beta-lactamase class C family)